MLSPEPVAVQRARALKAPPASPDAPHSVVSPGSRREGRSAVYRHWRFKDGLLGTLDPAVVTVHDAFETTANLRPKHPCLGHRPYDPVAKAYGPYVWEDYQTIQRRRANFGAGLVELHHRAGVTDDKYGVGLWCQNRPEWQITDLGCVSQSLYSVSIYDTLGPETTEYILNHAGLACVVTSVNHIPTLLKIKARTPTLKLIISLDPLDTGEAPGLSKAALLGPMAVDLGISLHYIGDVEALGAEYPKPYRKPTAEDIATINYTSGTTGAPKGVVLTHANAIAASSAAMVVMGLTSSAVTCSYLPLAHIYQRVSEHCALWAGSAIGYFHGNILELVDDLKLLRPTVFCSVPRLYNRFGSVIKAATIQQPGFKGALSRHIVSRKLAASTVSPLSSPSSLSTPLAPSPSLISATDKNGGAAGNTRATNKHVIYDLIWSRKVAAAFGLERTISMVSGSAPLDPSLHKFLRIVFANNFLQGYGLTETYAVSLAQLDGDMAVGSCGAPTSCVEACLLDVPDMEYLATDQPEPRGELLLRGPSCFGGYYRNAAETAKAIDADGWFHTGDICTIDSRGRFRVVDRVKNVLKLAQGEYVSPERIENVLLANCGWLATAFVHGDSHQAALVGIFGVAPDAFAPFASAALGRPVSSTDLPALEQVSQRDDVRKAAIAVFDKVARKNKLNGYERVRAVRFYIEPFTVENELLTPTLKLKRPQIAKRYRSVLDQLYAEYLGAEEGEKMAAKL